MCGIYGEFFNTKSLSKKEAFFKINDFNFSRGPNMSGYWSNNKTVQFGFRRLSILDTSIKGNQPMQSLYGKYCMVFNGEIYNFLELKEKLIDKGYSFNSTGDSEVLVNYFECFGLEKTLENIDGMFAIALFDNDIEELILIRDFAGIKPLHYSITNNDIVFGSRYDQIAKHPNSINNSIDNQVLKTYLKLHYIPAPFGILENTFQLEPGQYIRFNKNGIVEKKTYWQFPDLEKETLIEDRKIAIELVRKELKKAVKDQLIADVSLGTFLSGGIDSPLITSFAKEFKVDITSFTIGSDSKVHDESEDAIKYAKLIGVNLELRKMESSDCLKVLHSSMKHLQEPFADFSLLPTYQLTKNASDKFTVMLSGDGGDELFFGYERFNSVAKNLKYRFVPKSFRYVSYLIDKILFRNKHINECMLSDELSSSHQGLHSRTREDNLNTIFPNLKNIKTKELPFYKYLENDSEIDFYNSMRKAEFYGMMQKTLTKVDRMSMANSIEVRVPFLKKSFVELAAKIHPNLSIKRGSKKQLLKDILKKRHPKAPIDNRKRGFSVPLNRWLKEDLKDEFKEKIFDSNFIESFKINKSALKKIWNDHQKGQKDYKWLLFTIYSLQQWQENLKKE
ncbi:MAG: asparagine synthase (glutamine-hydrolyzing) [Flavobacteriaceae bacterium]|nr:asparagine synthase (glutamine-hydrolyzing) [Flavobacteriaceae bacterium]